MNFLFYATNLLLLVSFVVFVRQVVRAPEGHEDELGFHFGAPVPELGASPARRVKKVPAYVKTPVHHLAA